MDQIVLLAELVVLNCQTSGGEATPCFYKSYDPLDDIARNVIRHTINRLRLQAQIDLIIDIVHNNKTAIRCERDFGGEEIKAAKLGDRGRYGTQRAKIVVCFVGISDGGVHVGACIPPA